MKIDQTTGTTITALWANVEPRIRQAARLEEAAQALATALHTQFTESAVLARVYLTVPSEALPPTLRSFVETLATKSGARAALKGTTPVLSLVGTHGQEAAWNDRRNSQGHKGIPLVSAAFVDSIPMIARLLRELGVPMDWVDSHDAQRIVTTVGRTAGLFFVDDAGATTDDQGRKIIAAQDFVSQFKVKSVFGTGGAYPGGQIVVIVVFCRDRVGRTTAEQFLPLSDLFKSQTAALVGAGTVFSNP